MDRIIYRAHSGNTNNERNNTEPSIRPLSTKNLAATGHNIIFDRYGFHHCIN
jgi:hypothetical protein